MGLDPAELDVVKQPTAAPTRKVKYSALYVVIATVIVGLVSAYGPAAPQGWAGTLIGGAAALAGAYLAHDRSSDAR